MTSDGASGTDPSQSPERTQSAVDSATNSPPVVVRLDLSSAEPTTLSGVGVAAPVSLPQAGAGAQEDDSCMECRICQQVATAEEPVIRPCACTGSVAGVHPQCLEKWIQQRTTHMLERDDPDTVNVDDALTCEICHQKYQVRIRRQFVFNASMMCSCDAWRQYCDFCMLLLVAFCAAFASYMVLKYEWDNSGSTAKWIVIGFSVICAILFVLTGVRIFQRWRKINTVQHIAPGSPSMVADQVSPPESGTLAALADAGASGGRREHRELSHVVISRPPAGVGLQLPGQARSPAASPPPKESGPTRVMA